MISGVLIAVEYNMFISCYLTPNIMLIKILYFCKNEILYLFIQGLFFSLPWNAPNHFARIGKKNLISTPLETKEATPWDSCP